MSGKWFWTGLAVLAIALCVMACTKKPEPGGEMTTEEARVRETLPASAQNAKVERFLYTYNNSMGGCGYDYTVENLDGKLVFRYEADEHRNYGEMEMEIGPEFLEKLTALYQEHELYKWHDFHESDPEVLDGDGFYLSIGLDDGSYLSASGSNAAPEGYYEFSKELETLFAEMTKQLAAEKRAAIIAQGNDGKLDFIMLDFIQQGASGQDSYKVFITQEGEREKNVEINVESVSGAFLPEGDYWVYKALPNDEIGFEKVQEMYEKYGLLNWYDYDEIAEDYQNAEWFQLSFGFDNNFYLNACGTEHPENYDAFREEFLSYIAEFVHSGGYPIDPS